MPANTSTCSSILWTSLSCARLVRLSVCSEYDFDELGFCLSHVLEICAFNDRAKEFRDLGCEVRLALFAFSATLAHTEVIGVSIDSHFSHLAWSKQPRTEGGLGPLSIPLVADLTKEISQR